MATFATVIYYDLIVNVHFIHQFFPNYWEFLLASFVGMYMTLGLFGYYWRKKSVWWKASRDADVGTDPYQTEKLTPVSVPLWECLLELCRKEGVDVSQVEEIIKRSKEE